MNEAIKKIAGKMDEGFPRIRPQGLTELLTSFVVMVVAPMIVAAVYYSFFAVSVYQSEASIAVRKEATMPQDSVGVSLGASSALAVFADSFIVAEYAKSRKVVEVIMQSVDLGSVFSKGGWDPFYQYSANARIEETVAFWQDMVDADFDASTGIIKLKVRTFNSEDTLKIANRLAQQLQNLVAKLSDKAHREAVRFAEVSLMKSTEALVKHRQAIQDFRIKNEIVDPTSEVANLNTLITTLSQELIKLKTERAVVSVLTSAKSPKMKVLDAKIDQTLKVIQEIKKGQNDFKHVARLPEQLQSYELLKANYEIANQQYVQALERLGEANASAVLTQAHLYVFVPFSKAQSPFRPDLPYDFLTILLIVLGIWGIYRLIK